MVVRELPKVCFHSSFENLVQLDQAQEVFPQNRFVKGLVIVHLLDSSFAESYMTLLEAVFAPELGDIAVGFFADVEL